MNFRVLGVAVIASVVVLGAGVGSASATSCTGEYNSANGTKTLPGTDIGTVAAGCEIGPFSTLHGSNGNAASVSPSYNPSIYQFEWTGGNLSIQEELGNNGYGHIIYVELAAVGVTLNPDGSLSSSLVSIPLPYSSGLIAPVSIFDDYLASGSYVLDTYLGPCAPGVSNCSGGSSDDPQYQVLFTPTQGAPGDTPLPGTLALFGPGVLGLYGLLRRRRAA